MLILVERDVLLKKFLVAFFSVVLCMIVTCADISPTIKTIKLPSGQVLRHYSEQLSTDGTTPIKWFLIGGSLLSGLDFSENGLNSGTPSRKATLHFIVKASNYVCYVIQSLSININEEPISRVLTGGGCTAGYFGIFAFALSMFFIKKYGWG